MERLFSLLSVRVKIETMFFIEIQCYRNYRCHAESKCYLPRVEMRASARHNRRANRGSV